MLLHLALLAALGAPEMSYAPTDDQCAVNVRWPDASREILAVEGQTYAFELDLQQPGIRSVTSGGETLAEDLRAIVDGEPAQGPGRVNIYSFGTEMYEIHLRDLTSPRLEGADIELALYAYADRVFANINVVPPSGAPWRDLVNGWDGKLHTPIVTAADGETAQRSAAYAYWPDWPGLRYDEGMRWTVTEDAPVGIKGERSLPLALLAGKDAGHASQLLFQERRPGHLAFDVEGGVFDGYQPIKGFYQITTRHGDPRGFETAHINPNTRYEVKLGVKRAEGTQAPQPASRITVNVRNDYGVLEAAVLTDEDGYPLPIQVMTCKNFGGEKEEGEREGDHPYGESYLPLTVTDDAPFRGRCYHLFGNWGTHPLKQISSIRFYHHYFHASLGPTETMCYVPFEYPRPDDRDYVLADVRGISHYPWPGQPQRDHVSVVGLLRYKSAGRWVNNLLQDTRIYATAPNLASFALEYLSEDGKIRTTWELMETPQEDETRCFARLRLDVLEDVPLDAPSSQHLRFLNVGAYIVRTRWPEAAYTAPGGETREVTVPESNDWVLEAAAMDPACPAAAGYGHPHGNMALIIPRFEGRLGGEEASMFGLSCYGGEQWTELFLTAPEPLAELKKGDYVDAEIIVMPYGPPHAGFGPAERQRVLYGSKAQTSQAICGEKRADFPARFKADARGFAEFNVEHGADWTPLLVEGFKSHRAPMLWEELGGAWMLHDQQVHGNDWYQTYRAADGSIGFVFVVKLRPDMTHRYVVTQAPHATGVTTRNGFAVVEGGPMDFLSPVPFDGLDCQPVPDAPVYRCRGAAEQAVQSGGVTN